MKKVLIGRLNKVPEQIPGHVLINEKCEKVIIIECIKRNATHKGQIVVFPLLL